VARDGYLRARQLAKRIVLAREERQRQKQKQRASQQQGKQPTDSAEVDKAPSQQQKTGKEQSPRPKAG
jgi:hypothetical protein